MIKTKIVDFFKKAIKEKTEIEIFAPENEKFGHYSTNVALKLAKIKKENPLKIAEEIKSFLISHSSFLISRIEVAPPGFINFWLSAEALHDELKEILKQKEKYGKPKIKNRRLKINIEFISANPTGLLTIGNGRGGFLGDVLANISEFVGHRVAREYYVNDSKVSAQIKELGKTALGNGVSYKTKNLGFRIKKLGVKLKKIRDYGEAGYLLAQDIQKDNRKFIGEILRIKFDKWFSEQILYKNSAIKKLLKELKKKNLIYKKENALWLKTGQYGDSEDRVLVRATGEPTYFLPDLAYHLNKFKTRKFSKVIDIWGADHHGYEPRLRAGLKAIGIIKKSDEKFKIIITQLARLISKGKEVRMSKRKGEYVTLEDLIKEVGLDAARFFFLMHSPGTHMNFDLDLAKERSLKNPVYYVQYAAVRCGSIIKKSKTKNQKSKIQLKNIKFKSLNTPEDLNLIKTLTLFPEVIEEAAGNYNPQILVRYSLALAQEFHNFYEKERIIGENKDLMLSRLALIKATQTVFKNLFGILGISLPGKM